MPKPPEDSKALVSIEDLGGFGALGKRVIQAFEKATGAVLKAPLTRRNAGAEADAIRIIAQAEGDRIRTLGEAQRDVAVADAELADRALQRLVTQEVVHQENIEAIALMAAKEADDAPQQDVADRGAAVDQDWMLRFVDKAKGVGREELQFLWARIVAGEVREPGTYGLRTLETLSNLTTAEAQVFEIACRLCVTTGHILKVGKVTSLEQYGLSFDAMLMLRAAGLMHDVDFLVVEGDARLHFDMPPLRLVVIHPQGSKIKLQTWALTPTGLELSQVIRAEPNEEYLRDVAKNLPKELQVGIVDLPTKSVLFERARPGK